MAANLWIQEQQKRIGGCETWRQRDSAAESDGAAKNAQRQRDWRGQNPAEPLSSPSEPRAKRQCRILSVTVNRP